MAAGRIDDAPDAGGFWYGSYVLRDGKWQGISAFNTRAEAEETLKWHAAGRLWLVSQDLLALEVVINGYHTR